VVRYRDGRVEIIDEDEFEEHRVLFGYPAEVVATARATADQVANALVHRLEPFGAAGPEALRRGGL
jgi:protein associated with RNAse G/E